MGLADVSETFHLGQLAPYAPWRSRSSVPGLSCCCEHVPKACSSCDWWLELVLTFRGMTRICHRLGVMVDASAR